MTSRILRIGVAVVALVVATTVRAEPPASPAAGATAARARFQDAMAAFGAERFAEAAAKFEQAYALDAGLLTALRSAAASHRRAFETTGKIEPLRRSIELFERYERVDPAQALQTGRVLTQLRERLADEERRTKTATQSDLELAKGKFRDAMVRLNLGDFAAACPLLAEAYQHAPQNFKLLKNLAYCHRTHWERGQGGCAALRQAVRLYTQLRDVAPEEAAATDEILRRLKPSLFREESAELQRRAQSASGLEAIQLAEEVFAQKEVALAHTLVERTLREARAPRALLFAAHRLRALVQAAQGNAAGTEQAFRAALSLEPGYLPPAGLDEVARMAFERAARAAQGQPTLGVRHVPVASATLGAPIALSLAIEGDPAGLVVALEIAYRKRGVAVYAQERVPVAAKDARIPEAFSRSLGAGDVVEYHVAALGEHGGVLAQLGAAETPFSIELRAAPSAVAPPPGAIVAEPGSTWQDTAGNVALGAGAASALVAVTTFAVARWSLQGSLDKDCTLGETRDRCPPSRKGDVDTYDTVKGAIVPFSVLAIVGLAGGAALKLLLPKRPAEGRPVVRLDAAGLVVAF